MFNREEMQLMLYQKSYICLQTQKTYIPSYHGTKNVLSDLLFHNSMMFFIILPFFTSFSDNCRQDIAKHLLVLLEDEDIAIKEQASSLLPLIGSFHS